MAEPTDKTLRDVSKALIIIFIILIVTTNGSLLFSIVRRSPTFLYKPKTAILTSLAIGDLLVALFTLVVMGGIVFNDSIGVNNILRALAILYGFCLLPFVHAVGLMELAIERVLRHRRVEQTVNISNSSKQLLVSLLYSGVPWLLGLVVVLPLELYGFDFETCYWKDGISISLIRAKVWVPTIAPASIALVVCIAVICMRKLVGRGDMIALSIIQPSPQPCNDNSDSRSAPTGTYGNQRSQQYPDSRTPVVYSNGPTPDVRAERITMLGSAIANLVCVFPLSSSMLILNFYYSWSIIDGIGSTDKDFMSYGFTLLFTLRSVITPVVWLAYWSGSLR